MGMTVITDKQRRTFRKVGSAWKWAGKVRSVVVIITD